MQKNRPLSCPSLTKTDGSLHLVPGHLKAAHCSWGPGGRTVRDGKMQSVNSQRAHACVSCVASIYPRVCCSVSLVRIKSDKYYYYKTQCCSVGKRGLHK